MDLKKIVALQFNVIILLIIFLFIFILIVSSKILITIIIMFQMNDKVEQQLKKINLNIHILG